MNVIGFRLPQETEIKLYEVSEPVILDFNHKFNGFIISPFSPEKEPMVYPFSKALVRIPRGIETQNRLKHVFKETDKISYSNYIQKIQEVIDQDEKKKIVASRRKIITTSKSAGETFYNLCELFPEAFVFFISTPEFGTWIGATPETLLSKEGTQLRTMALAGTRKISINGDNQEWDSKNLKEQQIVTDYICQVFRNEGLNLTQKRKEAKKAGKLEHIATYLETQIPEKADLKKILKHLSPTPALSGFPKATAIELISQKEGDRELYGGYCGPVDEKGNFDLNVIIRCACFTGDGKAVLFGGGGITAFSDAEEEWEETERKMKALENIL